MIYRFFKILFIPAVRVYFKSIHIENEGFIPDKGPVILAVNHTSAFMDPILIAVKTNRILHFLARGEAFNSKFSRAFYNKLNMLPIYRPETTPGEVHKNKFAFQKSHEHLRKGKAIIIFPEGFSKTERRLRPIKSGLARIAFGAEVESGFNLNLKIVPVGINYSNPHLFRSDVFINIGQPILPSEYKHLFKQDEKKAYDELTEAVRNSLEQATIVIGDERQEEFIRMLEIIYGNADSSGSDSENELFEKFRLSKDVIRQVENISRKNPKLFTELENRVKNYIYRMSRLHLSHDSAKSLKKTRPFWNGLILLVGFLPFIFGVLSNCIPLLLTSLISSKVRVREDFVGSLKLTAGMFIFLIYYLTTTFTMVIQFSWIFFILIPITFYITGVFAINYLSYYHGLRDYFQHYWLQRNKTGFFNKIAEERKDIMKALTIS